MAEEKLETLPEPVKHHPSTYQVLARLRIQPSVKTLSKRQTKPKTAFSFDRMDKIVCSIPSLLKLSKTENPQVLPIPNELLLRIYYFEQERRLV